mgnify:CR=1 FL=1
MLTILLEKEAVDHGDLLVADTHYCRVLVYDTDLKLKRAYGAPGPAPGAPPSFRPTPPLGSPSAGARRGGPSHIRDGSSGV